MRRIWVTVAAVCCLAACTTKKEAAMGSGDSSGKVPAQSGKSGSGSGESQFQGTVGQLEDGQDFAHFLEEHDDSVVGLDVQMPAESFQGGEDADNSFFVLWADCEDMPARQKPNSGACTGFEYSVVKAKADDHPLVRDGNVWRLRGRFRVVEVGGPFDGKMAVRLEPARP